jgi:hypothetical protein
MKKKLKKLPRSFKYPKFKETDRHFGSGEIVGNILRPDGDWRPYQTPTEEQRRNGVESSSCFIEAQQATIASILEEQYEIFDQNFSARFNLIFSNATKSGGDPLTGAQTFRDRGLIPDSLLPFSDEIKTWDEFNSFKGGDKEFCMTQGKTWRNYWEPLYDVVFTKNEPLEEKYRKLRQALKYSPIPLSVYGVTDGTTYIKKPKGVSDTHMVKAVFVDDKNQIHIRDTYPPFDKILPPNYSSDFAMRWTVEKKEEKKISVMKQIVEKLTQLLSMFSPKPVVAPVVAPQPQPQPITEPVGSLLIEWATAIRDYEGRPGDLSYRNNNPGNLRSVQGPFLKFKTWEEGWKALLDYLTRAATGKHKAYKPDFTLLRFFQTYAPSADSNNPDLYAKYVAKRLGVPVTTKIKTLI